MFQNEQRITITARDLKVVSALQCDGRMTMQALADKVGISVYAATESYRRLIESGIMNIVPVCNPLSLGNYSQVLVGLRLDGSRDEALAMLHMVCARCRDCPVCRCSHAGGWCLMTTMSAW